MNISPITVKENNLKQEQILKQTKNATDEFVKSNKSEKLQKMQIPVSTNNHVVEIPIPKSFVEIGFPLIKALIGTSILSPVGLFLEAIDEEIACRFCQGSGDCSFCNGTGSSWDGECTYCSGSGKCWWCKGTGDDFALEEIENNKPL